MEDYQNKQKAIELFGKLPKKYRYLALLEMMTSGIIDLAPAMEIYAQHLTEYKRNASIDMQKLSDAGLDLAEKEIKKIPSIERLNTRQLKTAQAQTLLSVHTGYADTQFTKKLKKYVDMSIVDKKWYEQCWQLKTVQAGEKGADDE